MVAERLLVQVISYYVLPSAITSDRDPRFGNKFLRGTFEILNILLYLVQPAICKLIVLLKLLTIPWDRYYIHIHSIASELDLYHLTAYL